MEQILISYEEFRRLVQQEALLNERVAQLEDELSELKAKAVKKEAMLSE